MNIVFTVDSMGSGGAERVVSILSNEMIKKGHSVTIILVSSSTCDSFYELNCAIKLICLRKNNKKSGPFGRIKVLRKALKDIKPDSIISFLPHVNVYTYLASIGLKIPFFVSERNDPKTDPQQFFLRMAKKFVFKKASGCIFQTKQASDYYKGISDSKKIVIHNPIHFSPSTMPIKRKKIVLCVGRLVEQKNHLFTIRVFKQFHEIHRDYKMIIVGDGEEKNKIMNYIKDLELSKDVFLVGLNNNWINDYFDSAMFILSSFKEGMPNALIEAMSVGIPCISSNCPIGGPAELIENGSNGYLFDINNDKQLLDYMLKIADNDLLANLFYNNSYPILLSMNPSDICDRWLDFINEKNKK